MKKGIRHHKPVVTVHTNRQARHARAEARINNAKMKILAEIEVAKDFINKNGISTEKYAEGFLVNLRNSYPPQERHFVDKAFVRLQYEGFFKETR